MPTATFNGQTIAQSDTTEIVDGNHYFPPDSVNHSLLKASQTQTTCPWKGVATYFSVVVDGNEETDAAWTYPETKEAAGNIKGYYAFWKGVSVTE